MSHGGMADNYYAVLGAIQVLRNADGGGVSDFLGKSVMKV